MKNRFHTFYFIVIFAISSGIFAGVAVLIEPEIRSAVCAAASVIFGLGAIILTITKATIDIIEQYLRLKK